MKTYMLSDGTKLTVRNARELVHKMREVGGGRNDQEFMSDVAKRAVMQDHTAHIPTDNADRFVEALLRVGFIKTIDDNE